MVENSRTAWATYCNPILKGGKERREGRDNERREKKITKKKDFLIARGELAEGHLPIMDCVQLLAERERDLLCIISLVHIFACMRFMFKGY